MFGYGFVDFGRKREIDGGGRDGGAGGWRWRR